MSFRLKTIVGIGLIEGLLLILMVFSAQRFLRESNQEQFVQRATSTVKLFADASKDAVIATDLALLDNFVNEISTNPEVVYVRVVGQDDVELSSAGSTFALAKSFKHDIAFADIDDTVFDVSAPIIEADFTFGRVQIGFSSSKIDLLLENSKQTLTGIALVEILLVALFSFLLGTYLTHQLQYLKTGSEKLALGKLGYQIPVKGTDELAQTVVSFNHMSCKLKDSELRKEAYQNSALHAIITLNGQGQITECNGATEILFLSAREEIIDKHITDVMILENSKATLSLLKDHNSALCKLDLFSQMHESAMSRCDGQTTYLQWMISEIRLDDEIIYVLFVENINDRKEAEQSLLKSTRAAQEANRAKSEFLANMTHELRTPLQGIIGFSSLGVKRYDKVGKEKVLKYFETIQSSADTLLTLVNNLLDLTKLESGKMEYRFIEATINSVIEQVIGELQSQAADKNIKLIPPPVSLCINQVFDPMRLEQVVRNLLGNAIKFSDCDTTIECEVALVDNSTLVSIKDSGPGIPPAEIETIFDKFSQSSVTSDGSGGTGLGLPICREIVSAHQGRIYAVNNTEGGTTFTFTVPNNLPVSKSAEPSLIESSVG